jgi:hypothetical protein
MFFAKFLYDFQMIMPPRYSGLYDPPATTMKQTQDIHFFFNIQKQNNPQHKTARFTQTGPFYRHRGFGSDHESIFDINTEEMVWQALVLYLYGQMGSIDIEEKLDKGWFTFHNCLHNSYPRSAKGHGYGIED